MYLIGHNAEATRTWFRAKLETIEILPAPTEEAGGGFESTQTHGLPCEGELQFCIVCSGCFKWIIPVPSSTKVSFSVSVILYTFSIL